MENQNFRDLETRATFESRKKDHIEVALSPTVEASECSDLDKIMITHEALPDINFNEISMKTKSLGLDQRTPFLISSMTAGHSGSSELNIRLAKAAEARGWMMGVGSQRRELTDDSLRKEWRAVRQVAPRARLLGNIGIAQLTKTTTDQIKALAESIEATAMIVHLNALQEVMQVEGTTDFRGGLLAIENLCRAIQIPVIVKETGCGLSALTARRLFQVGVAAVDVSGLGGTHWGRVEGERAAKADSRAARIRQQAANTFQNWGLSTAKSVENLVLELKPHSSRFEIWGSGGVRTGLDAFKLLAMGARTVGLAKPVLLAALQGDEALGEFMERIEYELKVAMFCTGQKDLSEIAEKDLWSWTAK